MEENPKNDISMELKRVYSKTEPKRAARARYFNTPSLVAGIGQLRLQQKAERVCVPI